MIFKTEKELSKHCLSHIDYSQTCPTCEANDVCTKGDNFQELFEKLLIKRRKEKLKKLLS